MSTFEEIYDLTGHGTFNHLALLTNGFILLYVTVECLGLGYVLNIADCDLKVTVGQRGAISAATFIGVVTPAIIWGYLGDTYGRRKVMLPATILAVLFSIISSMSQNFISMLLLRILTGVMISASCATAYVYLGELTSPSRRAVSIAWGSAFIAGSYFTMPISAWIFLPRKFSFNLLGFTIVPWRVLMWAYTIWGSAACVGMAILPESPSFLLSSRGGPAALAVLAKIYSWNMKKPADEFPVKEFLAAPRTRPSFKDSVVNMKYLVKPPLLRCVLLTHVCNFMVFMQSNAFYVWMPHIVGTLLKHGRSNQSKSMCSLMGKAHKTVKRLVLDQCVPTDADVRLYPIATLVGFVTVFVYVAIAFGMKRWGKAKLYCVIMTSCAILIVLSVLVPNWIAAIALFIPGLCGIAANTVLAAAIVEVFPTNLRAMAMCTLFMVGRLGAAVGANTLSYGLQQACIPVVVCISAMTAVSGILLFMWPDSSKTRTEMEAKGFSY